MADNNKLTEDDAWTKYYTNAEKTAAEARRNQLNRADLNRYNSIRAAQAEKEEAQGKYSAVYEKMLKYLPTYNNAMGTSGSGYSETSRINALANYNNALRNSENNYNESVMSANQSYNNAAMSVDEEYNNRMDALALENYNREEQKRTEASNTYNYLTTNENLDNYLNPYLQDDNHLSSDERQAIKDELQKEYGNSLSDEQMNNLYRYVDRYTSGYKDVDSSKVNISSATVSNTDTEGKIKISNNGTEYNATVVEAPANVSSYAKTMNDGVLFEYDGNVYAKLSGKVYQVEDTGDSNQEKLYNIAKGTTTYEIGKKYNKGDIVYLNGIKYKYAKFYFDDTLYWLPDGKDFKGDAITAEKMDELARKAKK